MAYTEKYFHQFCKLSGKVCRISIQKRDYVGSSIELEGQPDPILISYDNSDEFKFKPIVPSTAEIFLTFGTGNGVDFSEFWEADEKTFKIVYTVAGEVEWVGFVLLEGFAYELSGGVYYAQITATDGLGTLESILFKDQNTGQKYGLTDLTYNEGFKFPLILIATEILRKLELDLDLWTLVDVYEQNQTDRTSDSRNSDPLAITQVNVKTYINGSERNDIPYYQEVDEAWDCKKVMENLLYVMCGSQLFQENGKWKIKRFGIDAKYGLPYPIKLDEFKYFYKADFNDDPTTYANVKNAIYDESLDLYMYVDAYNINIGDYCSNDADFSSPAKEGYYKFFYLGKIIEVSSNGSVIGITNYDKPVYKWHKYNTLAGYIGSEELDNTIFIPCKDKNKFLLGNDHVLRMDDLYKQFRVNYEYTYLKDGDSPDNFIKNGNFEQDFQQYGKIEAPPEWYRIKWGSYYKYPRLRVEDIPLNERIYANGETKMLTMGRQYNNLNIYGKEKVGRPTSALGQNNIIVTKGDETLLRVFVRYNYRPITSRYYPMFRIFLAGSENCYFLLNDFKSDENYKTQWSNEHKTSLIKKYPDGSINLAHGNTSSYNKKPNIFQKNPDFLYLNAKDAENYDEDLEHDERWYEFNYRIPPIPESGQIAIYVHGLASSRKTYNNPSTKFYGVSESGKTRVLYMPNIKWVEEDIDMHLASINIGKTYTKDEVIPSEDYIYANENVNYTDQREPIEIFNGDTEDVVVQSSLIVPTNNTGGKNKWDTSNNDFGKSDLGLILCKSVMKQYGNPSRLLEGGVAAEDATYGTRFLFEAIPNTYFMLLRGDFNPIKGYIEDATFAEIGIAAIKRGGIINGESLDPVWDFTGEIRCIKENDLNTGYYEEEQLDINRNSETFGVTRWVLGEEDTELCPIGQPSKYYWGCDNAGYQLANFTDYTVLNEENNTVSVGYTQEGGKYIYFLHLASLGTVNRISNEFQYNIISSFQYLADITINGYLYRVLRQDFVTAEMDNFSQTFDFN